MTVRFYWQDEPDESPFAGFFRLEAREVYGGGEFTVLDSFVYQELPRRAMSPRLYSFQRAMMPMWQMAIDTETRYITERFEPSRFIFDDPISEEPSRYDDIVESLRLMAQAGAPLESNSSAMDEIRRWLGLYRPDPPPERLVLSVHMYNRLMALGSEARPKGTGVKFRMPPAYRYLAKPHDPGETFHAKRQRPLTVSHKPKQAPCRQIKFKDRRR